MTGEQIKNNQTQTAAEKFSDLSASFSKTEPLITSVTQAIDCLEKKADEPVSTLSSYKADVTLYLALLHRRSFGQK